MPPRRSRRPLSYRFSPALTVDSYRVGERDGDVTRKEPGGRIVAVFVMLEGVALLTITIAVITSTLVTRAAREREDALAAGDDEG